MKKTLFILERFLLLEICLLISNFIVDLKEYSFETNFSKINFFFNILVNILEI